VASGESDIPVLVLVKVGGCYMLPGMGLQVDDRGRLTWWCLLFGVVLPMIAGTSNRTASPVDASWLALERCFAGDLLYCSGTPPSPTIFHEPLDRRTLLPG
jgi:hypothetical protein